MVAFFVTVAFIILLIGFKFAITRWQNKQRFVFHETGVLQQTQNDESVIESDDVKETTTQKGIKDADSIGEKVPKNVRERIELTSEDFTNSMKIEPFQLTSPELSEDSKKMYEPSLKRKEAKGTVNEQKTPTFVPTHRRTPNAPVKKKSDDLHSNMLSNTEYKDCVFYLISEKEPINGKVIKLAVDKTRMRYDPKNKCFIRKVDGQEWFRLCNAVNPLLFDLAELNRLKTPGIVLAMRLPVNLKAFSKKAFKEMCDVVKQISRSLRLTVCDANRVPLKEGDLEAMQQSIAEEFESNS